MIGPIVDGIGDRHCLILAAAESVLASLPAGLAGTTWRDAMKYDRQRWRAEFAQFWPDYSRKVRDVCRQHRFSPALISGLRLSLLLASQYIAGCDAFLRKCRPLAVLTDHDRHRMWSALILVARRQGIPTYTLVHGAVNDNALGYVPLVADKAFCWGELDRNKLIASGADPARLFIAGCPRLRKGLLADRAVALAKVELDPGKPLVLLATAPYDIAARLQLAGTFCEAIKKLDGVSGAVRLHPSETLNTYSALIARYPDVRFLANSSCTQDEALAAAEVVVVHSSGFGSDALYQGRLAIVLDVLDEPLGHGADLVRYAECPKPRSAGELADAVRALLWDAAARDNAFQAAKRFNRYFCAACGEDAAGNIADVLLGHLGASRNTIGPISSES
ncbi:MAG: hypothetical protein ABSG68_01095 [Thermoguttaceae bacterium]|jgi:hypothetical protein